PARLQLRALLPRAAAVIVVSKKLGVVAHELGVPEEKIHVVYNGVSRSRFCPMDRSEARHKLGLPIDGEVVVSVGHLAEHKGTKDLLEAVPLLAERRPNAIVAFVGD